MSPLQRESCLLMIEKGWTPLVGVVARITLLRALAELLCMGVFVAIAAPFRSFCEVYVSHRQLEVRWFVAVCTSHTAMRSQQWKACGVMVELRQILPLLCRVAGLATKLLAVCAAR